MKTQCPHCNTNFSVSDDFLNKKAKCSNCKQVFTVNPIQETATTNKTDKKELPLGSASNPVHTTVMEMRKSISGIGIASLVLGIIACISCWIPFVGCLVVPIGLIGLLLGIIGFLVSLFGRRSGCGLPLSGAFVSLLSVIIAISVTGAMSTAVEEITKKAVLAKNNQVNSSSPQKTEKTDLSDSNSNTVKKTPVSKNDVQDYVNKIQIYDLSAKYFESFGGKKSGVEFKVKNLGDKTITELKIVVFFKDKNNATISEEDFFPINTESFSAEFRKPLKPGYIWTMPEGKFLPAESVPNEWQEGNVSISIADIKFEK
jgi:predicted Zn finger-like uncharacterized protein